MALSSGGDRLAREIDEYALRLYKTDPKDSNHPRLPRCWSSKDRSRTLKLSHFALAVTYGGGYSERHDPTYNNHEPATVRADVPIPLTTGIYYFEVTVSNKGNNGRSVSVGVVTKSSNLTKLPGCEHSSFGYHNDGSVYHGSSSSGLKFGPRIVENDTVGCGIDFMSRSLFFTRNGIFLGKAFEGKIPASPGTRIYPAVGLQGRGARLTANFGQRPFSYAFDLHIKRVRALREKKLIESVCKEEFAGPKMRELVSGYLVHHGYVATAQTFSRWASVPTTPMDPQITIGSLSDPFVKPTIPTTTSSEKPPTGTGAHARPGESPVVSRSSAELSEMSRSNVTPSIPRRHSDSSCIAATDSSTTLQLPGLASMLHRRRLRALCRRCQYGKAAATLNALYPQVLERCPELLVQLRCRQLIEMMRRHAIRCGRSSTSNQVPESTVFDSATAPPKVPKVSDAQQHVRSGCCFTENTVKQSRLFSSRLANQNGNTSAMAMDVDWEDSDNQAEHGNGSEFQNSQSLATCGDFEDDPEVGDMDYDDDDDDDGFGLDDDTGVCINSVVSDGVNCTESGSLPSDRMEVDIEAPRPTTAVRSLSGRNGLYEDNETLCLLRHVQFGRSLVNLVKQVRARTGGLSLETERLLQQSVSLLAYSSPTSTTCPLRNLLDPIWRDTIANVINSAVLKAHDLPVQPALEQGLRALQRCFQDQYFIEAQTLGHFLLYHLTPSQLAKAERDSAAQQQATKRHRFTSAVTTGDSLTPGGSDKTLGSSSRPSVSNGHTSDERRTRGRDPRATVADDSPNDRCVYEPEDCSSSSLEDVLSKCDDEEDDDDDDGGENTESGRCHVDDIDENEGEDDDDDDHDGSRTPASVSRPQPAHEHGFSDSRGGSSSPVNRSPNGGTSSGRMHISGAGHRIRQFSALYRSSIGEHSPSNIRPARHAVFSRYCPAILFDPSNTRILAAIPSPTLSNARRLINRATRTAEVDSPISPRDPRSHVSSIIRNNRPVELEAPPNQYVDSAFSGLVSMTYPQHAEFLAAMNDALKVYAGSFLLNDDENSGVASNRLHRQDGPPPPPTAGGSACAP
ncbi:hypothetical protein P879_03969 [Paragonimus westermani]|uniref:Ran-binding protein 10 n=1 Tax=Paragonimus westermani TaxID=34504 RepID=A0A8T0DP63_9TREM|nr:hypothetical protein P879_03969 [Paragonimus westermani]